jgi:hypothetical protein
MLQLPRHYLGNKIYYLRICAFRRIVSHILKFGDACKSLAGDTASLAGDAASPSLKKKESNFTEPFKKVS